jgi:hypothetical protein
MEFDQITKRMFIGGGPADANDIQSLVNAGVTAIIDCRQLNDESLCLGALRSEITVLYNPTEDDGSQKPVSWFKNSLDFVNTIFTNPKAIVYAHCDAGVNRGPSTAYFLLRALYGLFGDDAKHIIHIHRPVTIAGIRYADDADAAIKALGL